MDLIGLQDAESLFARIAHLKSQPEDDGSCLPLRLELGSQYPVLDSHCTWLSRSPVFLLYQGGLHGGLLYYDDYDIYYIIIA